jgi:beta-glucosidase-like glycosyl hydrolase
LTQRSPARLVCPALRWRRGSFASERAKIRSALATGVGGFILFGGTRAAVAALTAGLRTTAGRGLLVGSDLERGPGQQIRGLTELPPPAALGFINDLDATARCGTITAMEARAVGINWVFAPVCDLDVEPKNPIVQTRSFGADPDLVGSHAAAWIGACQREGVLACAKHYPGHGRTTTDSHEGVPVVETPVAELQQTDVAPFAAAIQAGVGSVMPGFVAYPSWDPTGSAAMFSRPILDYLRATLAFDNLVVTDAFIMGGATAAAPEASAALAAVNAGCDMLLYPTDWAAVARALRALDSVRIEQATERYERALASVGSPATVTAPLSAHQEFADGLADRSLHLLRGEPPSVGNSVSVTIVDDDVGGPYAIPPRDVIVRELAGGGISVSRSPEPGTRHLVLVYAEPRSWKGRGDLGSQTIARIERLMPHVSLVILFAHPRLVAQIPGDVPVLCAWHGQALMQRAAARWVLRRR